MTQEEIAAAYKKLYLDTYPADPDIHVVNALIDQMTVQTIYEMLQWQWQWLVERLISVTGEVN